MHHGADYRPSHDDGHGRYRRGGGDIIVDERVSHVMEAVVVVEFVSSHATNDLRVFHAVAPKL